MPAYLQKNQQLFRYIGIAAIALLAIGLIGWYFLLRGRTGDIEQLDAARGFNIAVPSFTGTRSSTSENITGGIAGGSLLFVPRSDQRPPRLWRASQSPIAGMGFLATSTALRYVERSTGYLYDIDPMRGTVTRRTTTLVPRVYDAEVLSDGAVVLHVLNAAGERLSILGRVSATTTDDGLAELEMAELGTNIRDVAASPTGPDMLLIAERANGADVIRSTSAGDDPQIVAEAPVASLDLSWLPDGRIFGAERPASGVGGGVYELEDENWVPLLSAIPGLAALPRPGSSALLYSLDDGNRLRLFAQPAEGATIAEFSAQTSAEKCVWAAGETGTSSAAVAYCAVPQSAPAAGFTDSWKRGAAHTQDSWFRIDVSAASTERFFIPESSVALDVERPRMDPRGGYIAFMNARDKSLWVLRIAE